MQMGQARTKETPRSMQALSKWPGSAVCIFLLTIGGCSDDSVTLATNDVAPQFSDVPVESLGATRPANRVQLAAVGQSTMLHYYERDTAHHWLSFAGGTSFSPVLLSECIGIQSDRAARRGTRLDQVEHFLPTLVVHQVLFEGCFKLPLPLPHPLPQGGEGKGATISASTWSVCLQWELAR